MRKHLCWFGPFVACCVLLVAGTAHADDVRITGAFTSFTGIVVGDNSPTSGNFIDWCGADSCGSTIGVSPGTKICPDAGCTSGVGLATNFQITMDPANDVTSQVFFNVSNNPPENKLIFRANRGPTGGTLSVPNPDGRFKLGTLSFTNGLWTGNADFGFSIVANDITTHQIHEFDGFVRMILTPNTGTAFDNADYIYLTNAAGNPVISPLTLTNLPSIRALEDADCSGAGCNTETVDIFGQFGSLDLTDFANPVGGGFLDPSLTPALTPTPEPHTLLLLSTGLLVMAGTWRRSLLIRSSHQH